jgi:hypothetical protein
LTPAPWRNGICLKIIATADKVMGEAAQLLDFEVIFFGER